jgi:dihydroxyacetone kinase-like protein
MSLSFDAALVASWMRIAAQMLQEACPELTRLDAARGDGDHGVNMERGFAAIADALSGAPAPTAGGALLTAASVLRKTTGGTSGALWAGALRRAGKACQSGSADEWALLAALDHAAAAVAELGGASEGENTLLDSLLPAARAIRESLEAGGSVEDSLAEAARAAEDGAAATAGRTATKGRASYLGARGIETPDPGAVSAALVVKALHTAVADTLSDSPRLAQRG